jgi:hypothetical protein
MNKNSLLILAAPVLCSFVRVTDYSFTRPDRHWHFEGDYQANGKASFRSPDYIKHSHVFHAESYGAAYYTQFVNPENSLSAHMGYSQVVFDWKANPRFTQDVFQFVHTSIGWVSDSVKNWRWVVSSGFSFEPNGFAFGKSAVYNGMGWGRYALSERMGIHVGVWGYGGIHNSYVLPVVGIDWRPTKHWGVNGVFPLDTSLQYYFNDSWDLKLAYVGFGGPYKYPIRAHGGINGFKSPICMIHSTGVELGLRYRYKDYVALSVGGGWDFGGWILIKNGDNRRGAYFKYDSTPYGQANVMITF